jgi:hypothetical protein
MSNPNISIHLEDGELLRARHDGSNGTFWLTLCFGCAEVSTYFNSEEEARIYWLAIQSAMLKVEAMRKPPMIEVTEALRIDDEAAP